MPTYRVDMTTWSIEKYSIKLEAESEDEAERMALEFPYADWELRRNTKDTTVKVVELYRTADSD